MRQFGLEALIRAVHDGDTMHADIDQGLGIWNKGLSRNGMGLRLYGCNSRELNMPGGIEARDNLATLFPVGTTVPIVCRAWDKWSGRIDVSITLPDGMDLVEYLIAGDWAARWDGNGIKPRPPWPRP